MIFRSLMVLGLLVFAGCDDGGGGESGSSIVDDCSECAEDDLCMEVFNEQGTSSTLRCKSLPTQCEAGDDCNCDIEGLLTSCPSGSVGQTCTVITSTIFVECQPEGDGPQL